MRFIILPFIISSSAFCQPAVSNVRIPAVSLSHGSAQVLFDTSQVLSPSACGPQFDPGKGCYRARLKTSSCSSGIGGTLFYNDYHAVSPSQYSLAMNLSGLAPATLYYVCPEVSSNGVTWSTGVEQTFTTAALPAVHPALPIAPTAFVIPPAPAIGGGSCGSGSGTCAVAADCSDLQSKINAAVFGDTVTIPAGTICSGAYTLPNAPDARSFATTDVTTSASAIHVVAHGFADQQGIRFSSTGCLPGTIVPSDIGFFNCSSTGGLLPGYLYYVKAVDANNFQVSRTPGGPALNFGYVRFVATVIGSTITVQPGEYEQSYKAFSNGLSFDTATPFQLSSTGTLPAGLSSNTDYYFKTSCTNIVKCVTQISLTSGGPAVAITGTGSGVHTLTHKGTGTHYVLRWPPVNSSYVTIRTASPNSSLPPDGVRVSPAFQPVMATLRQSAFYSTGSILFSSGILSHNYRLIGLEFTTAATGAADIATTTNPRPYGRLISIGQDAGNIIFDRNYIHGRGYPNRLGAVAIEWNGANTAFVNSYLDQLDYWHPVITSGFTPSSTSFSVTLTAGSGYGTRTLHPVTSSSTLISITGGSATGIGNIYVDMARVMQIRIPIGMSATCTVTGIVCSVSAVADTSIPLDANGRIKGLKLATFGLVSGAVLYASPLDPFGASEATEGCQAIIAGAGPGPYNFTNNYISGTGIPLHFDDGGNHYNIRADYTIQRNFFNTPKSQQQGHPTSDGLRYGHRQPVEWKGGKRILLDGNEFSGNFMDDTRSSHTVEMTPRAGGTITDASFTNNSIHDAVGGFSMIGAIDPSSVPLARFRLANNLVHHIDGGPANQATPQAGFAGVGWQTSGGFGREDYTIDHNTFYSTVGAKPSFHDIYWDVMEGFAATNNLIWVDSGTTGFTFAGNEEPPGCVGLAGKAAADCVFVSGPGNPLYTFKNVLVPAGNNTQANLQAIYGSLLTAAQVPANAGAVGWGNPALNNYRLRSSSAYISGGHTSTDGRDQGIDQDVLEDAQGGIKNVRTLNITAGGATIAFHAPDKAAACYVAYGTGPTGTWTATAFDPLTWSVSPADTSVSQERLIGLSGLSAKTEYFYQAWCAGTTPTTTQNMRTL